MTGRECISVCIIRVLLSIIADVRAKASDGLNTYLQDSNFCARVKGIECQLSTIALS